MKLNTILAIISLTLLTISCKKSGSNATTNSDCETGNYGILKVSFTDAAHGHYFTVQELDNSSTFVGPIYKKIDSAGILSDTMHLRPLASTNSWYVEYVSFYTLSYPYKSAAANITTLKQCLETDLNVDF
jgi:hypothetical protein